MGAVVADVMSLLGRSYQVGPYTLIRRIGQGGMAEVYLACTTAPEQERQFFAIKLILQHLHDEPGFEKMLLREAALAASLDHPNIVKVVDFSESDHYIAMEYIDGKPLREFMRKASERGPGPLRVSLSIIHALCQALHTAHESTDEWGQPLGLVHRDVTPSNVLVAYDGRVKLADFGIAKATNRGNTTIGGSLKGKVGYMSPEQCRCENVDRRSDVFSLGVLLYELTVGQRLFPAINEFGIMGRLLRGEFPQPLDVVEDYPPALNEIVTRATAVEPEDRYQTAAELAEAIENFALDYGVALAESVVRKAMDRYFPPIGRTRIEWLAAEALGENSEEVKTWVYGLEDMSLDEEEYCSVTEPIMLAVSGESPQLLAATMPIAHRPRRPSWIAAFGGVCLAVASIAGSWMVLRPDAASWPAVAQDVLGGEAEVSEAPTPQPEPEPVAAVLPPLPLPPAVAPAPPRPEELPGAPVEPDEEIDIEDEDESTSAPTPTTDKPAPRTPKKKTTKRRDARKRDWAETLDTVRPYRGEGD